MLKKTIFGVGLVALLFVVCCSGGCAGVIASADTDAAIRTAAHMNLNNVRKAGNGRSAVWDKELSKVEKVFESQLSKVTSGQMALIELTKYRTAKTRVEAGKAADMEKIGIMVGTANWIVTLIDRKIGIRAGWNALIGRSPTLSAIKTLAEAEGRAYMENVNNE